MLVLWSCAHKAKKRGLNGYVWCTVLLLQAERTTARKQRLRERHEREAQEAERVVKILADRVRATPTLLPCHPYLHAPLLCNGMQMDDCVCLCAAAAGPCGRSGPVKLLTKSRKTT